MEEEDDGEYLPNADSDLDDEDMGSEYEDVEDEEAYLRGAVPHTGNMCRGSPALDTCERVVLPGNMLCLRRRGLGTLCERVALL